MPDQAEPLLQEKVPSSVRCGLKVLTRLFLLTGFGFAVLLSSMYELNVDGLSTAQKSKIKSNGQTSAMNMAEEEDEGSADDGDIAEEGSEEGDEEGEKKAGGKAAALSAALREMQQDSGTIMDEEREETPMRKIKIWKVILHIGVGTSGDQLMKASKVLEQLSGQEPRFSKARHTVRSFGIRRNENIACFVTINKEKAEDLLQKCLKIKGFELPDRAFRSPGLIGFGIQEHIDLGMKYDPNTGIWGMHICVVLTRAGHRIGEKVRYRHKVGNSHLVTEEETKKWFQDKFDGVVLKTDRKKGKDDIDRGLAGFTKKPR